MSAELLATYIGEGMFYKAKKLEEVRLPDTVTAVGWCSFSSCSSLATSTWLEIAIDLIQSV